MSSKHRIEQGRGSKESRRQLAVLREKWPLAFPVEDEHVRPLAMGAAREIAAAMGWSLPYTQGVLAAWKLEPVYCEAILSHGQRIALDGSPAETVEAEAKDLATKRLAELAAHKSATVQAPSVVTPTPTPAPRAETPEQLRARVRASLLAGTRKRQA